MISVPLRIFHFKTPSTSEPSAPAAPAAVAADPSAAAEEAAEEAVVEETKPAGTRAEDHPR